MGMAGSRVTAPGQADTVSAAHVITPTPHPMGASARLSRPKGMRPKATTAQGMVQSAVAGTAIRLAARP